MIIKFKLRTWREERRKDFRIPVSNQFLNGYLSTRDPKIFLNTIQHAMFFLL